MLSRGRPGSESLSLSGPQGPRLENRDFAPQGFRDPPSSQRSYTSTVSGEQTLSKKLVLLRSAPVSPDTSGRDGRGGAALGVDGHPHSLGGPSARSQRLGHHGTWGHARATRRQDHRQPACTALAASGTKCPHLHHLPPETGSWQRACGRGPAPPPGSAHLRLPATAPLEGLPHGRVFRRRDRHRVRPSLAASHVGRRRGHGISVTRERDTHVRTHARVYILTHACTHVRTQTHGAHPHTHTHSHVHPCAHRDSGHPHTLTHTPTCTRTQCTPAHPHALTYTHVHTQTVHTHTHSHIHPCAQRETVHTHTRSQIHPHAHTCTRRQCTPTHTHTPTCTHVHTQTQCIPAHPRVHPRAHTCTRRDTHTQTHAYTRAHRYLHRHTHVHLHAY